MKKGAVRAVPRLRALPFPLAPCERASRAVRVGWKRKGPAASYSRTGESRTTLGDGALDFRVRNGNGYDSPSVATGPKAGSSGTRENHNATDRGGSFE